MDAICDRIVQDLSLASVAREHGLANARKALRASANATRALHRGERDRADELLTQARTLLVDAEAVLAEHPSVRWAGFVHDAEKEYAEARLTEAVLSGTDIGDPDSLGVTQVAWLHGIAECVGELRRSTLDSLREGEIETAEKRVEVMEAMYEALLRIDYPEAMTAGLRRATDAARGTLERTRADVTSASVQRRLESAIERHLSRLGE